MSEMPSPAAQMPGSAPPLEPRSARRPSWPLAAAAAGLALIGGALMITAALLPSPSSATTTTQQPSTPPTRTSDGEDAAERRGTAGSSSITGRADAAWVSRMAEVADIPERALAAYAGAALTVAETHPTCHLGWNTLAGIGLVESEHGTIDGSSMGPDGVARPEIVGIPLDGNGVEAIGDTDAGAMDGDDVWDRAVGPMQFIPTTWTAYGQDGNRDGRVEVHQIDDAALAAAVYLCEAGDLSDGATWIAAISTYNPSVEYNNRVAHAATTYASLP
jgi:membrane-bound lytic murein transglycosylase B